MLSSSPVTVARRNLRRARYAANTITEIQKLLEPCVEEKKLTARRMVAVEIHTLLTALRESI